MADNIFFPDNTKLSEWFFETTLPKLSELGTPYVITNYGVKDDGKLYTAEIQQLIDDVSAKGGGVIVVPKGTYMAGALFIKPGVNLYIEKDGVLKGSDDIADYPVMLTRIEGQTCKYFSAFLNVDGVDGFVLGGEGAIDGNGLRTWKSFWQRRTWNPECTNKDEQRARLIYISNSKDVTVFGLSLRNSQFWTNHLYRCERVKYINCTITSPSKPIEAPSTDALDIDVCKDILVKGCYMSVNDDAVVLKGGKGVDATELPENGPCENVFVTDCTFGFCHACVTMGSECIHAKNVYVLNCKASGCNDFLRFKLRPDTCQLYEEIKVENIDCTAVCFTDVNAWTQFYDPGDGKKLPKSVLRNIYALNCKGSCEKFYGIKVDESRYDLSDFYYENLDFTVLDTGINEDVRKYVKQTNVNLTVDPECEASRLGIDTDKIM